MGDSLSSLPSTQSDTQTTGFTDSLSSTTLVYESNTQFSQGETQPYDVFSQQMQIAVEEQSHLRQSVHDARELQREQQRVLARVQSAVNRLFPEEVNRTLSR